MCSTFFPLTESKPLSIHSYRYHVSHTYVNMSSFCALYVSQAPVGDTTCTYSHSQVTPRHHCPFRGYTIKIAAWRNLTALFSTLNLHVNLFTLLVNSRRCTRTTRLSDRSWMNFLLDFFPLPIFITAIRIVAVQCQ